MDFAETEELIEAIGERTARRIRTAIKGGKKLYKALFYKSAQEIATSWKSKAERARHSGNKSQGKRGNKGKGKGGNFNGAKKPKQQKQN